MTDEHQPQPEFLEYARQVALGLGMFHSLRDEQPYSHLLIIDGPEGSAVHLSLEGTYRDFDKADRIAVGGGWPAPYQARDQLHQFYPWDSDDRPTITIAKNRGPLQCARDIQKRFLADYMIQWRKQVAQRELTICRCREQEEIAARFSGILGHPVDRDRYQVSIGSVIHADFSGNLEVRGGYNGSEPTISLTARSLTPELAEQIAALLTMPEVDDD